MSEHDKRRYRRFDTQQAVWVEGQDVRVTGEALNMSKGGMFVVTKDSAPSLGSTLQVKFDDPREGKIEVTMQVVWRDESTVASKLGLQALDSGGMAALERVVSHYERTPPRGSEPSRPDVPEGDKR